MAPGMIGPGMMGPQGATKFMISEIRAPYTSIRNPSPKTKETVQPGGAVFEKGILPRTHSAR